MVARVWGSIASWAKTRDSRAAAQPIQAVPTDPIPITITDSVISKHLPTLNGGRIEGNLRVFHGEAFNINGSFQLTGDLYTVGTPNIVVNSGASHGGVVSDGGGTTPSGYQVTLNSGVNLPGKIHTNADALTLPADIPSSVPAPSGSRTININSAADMNNIGDWQTVQNLNFTLANERVEGTFKVVQTTGVDDDHIGFVFGYQDSRHYYLFDWKKADQNDPLGFAEKGMSVKVVRANRAVTAADLWPTTGNGSRVRNIYHNQIPWADTTLYSYTFAHRPGEIEITIREGNSVLASFTVQDSTYLSGKFGFYAYSQEGVEFSLTRRSSQITNSYSYQVQATDPENDALTYSLVNAPEGMTIGSSTGLISWTTLPQSDLGPYNITVKVEDSNGAATTQDYTIGTINHAPVVSINPTQPITFPLTKKIALMGAICDDNLPDNGRVTTEWIKVSGPGSVIFLNPTSPVTNATFNQVGTYVLRLTATDSHQSDSADITVAVNQSPYTLTATPQTVSAGQPISVSWTASSGSSSTDWIAMYRIGDPNTSYMQWFYTQGATSGTFTFTALLQAGQYEFRYLLQNGFTHSAVSNKVIVDSSTQVNRAPVVNAGVDQLIRISSSATLLGVATDDGLPVGSSLNTTWSKISGGGNVTFVNVNAAETIVTFSEVGVYVLRLTATDGILSSSDDMVVTVIHPTGNLPPTVFAGLDQTVTLPGAANLNGYVADEGFPTGAAISLTWSKVSGTGSVTFANPNQAITTASFSQSGTYVLRLSASDGERTGNDDVTITVNPNVTNQPPTVDAGQNQSIELPTNSVTLSGVTNDDGLPTGSTLSIQWTKTSGTGNVTFANANQATTTATFSTAGVYVLRLTVSDSEYTVFDEVVITVAPQNLAPVVNAGNDQLITLSQQATLNDTATDDGLPAGSSLTVSWTKVSGAGDVTFSNPNNAATFATFTQTGVYVLRLTASDGSLQTSDDVTVTVDENQPAPVVEIITPTDGASVTEPTDVIATVSSGSGSSSLNWKLEYSLATDDVSANRSWTTAATGSGSVTNQALAQIDSTLMLNGLYDVRLTATDQYGQSASDVASVVAEKNLKVGNFTVSFSDLSVPVAGIPIEVIRTYDSRDKRVGDFGYGWTLGIRNIRVEKSSVLGLRWYETASATFPPQYCVEATRPHIVTVTMPDGKVFKFEARVTPQCQNFTPITGGTLTFIPMAGTVGKLEVLGDNAVQIAGSIPGPVDLIGFNGQGIFNSSRFKFTTEDGTEFVINQQTGLETIRDTNNNQLTINANGIFHSSGKSVTFVRDSFGRITQIQDPAGEVMSYVYDAAGDLISFTDRALNTTTFTYLSTVPHHLEKIVDPRGIQPIRNEYDANGRLLKHVDAFGREIVYTHNLAARVEIVNDRLNQPTRYEYDERGNVLLKRDSLGNEMLFSYDANDNVLSETNALGKTTVYTYDAFDHRTSMTDPLGNRTEFTYNSRGQVLTTKDARNNVTTNTFDSAGNLLTTKDALNNMTRFTYNIQNGLLSSQTNALNQTTSYQYNSFGYMTKETDPTGHETRFGYDGNGNRVSSTTTRTLPNNQTETITTTFEYDSLNRLKKTIYADGTFSQVEYNSIGQQHATIDQAGRRTEFLYDSMGRLIKTTYPDSSFEETTYDAEGRRKTSKDRLGRVTSFDYDVIGRLVKTTYPDATFTTTTYDANGQVKTSTDARGNVTTYFYDDAGRRTSVKNALNQITSFAYDTNGNQLSMTDALNRAWSYEYDSLNRRTKTIYPDSTFDLVVYDALGRNTSKTDQAGKITQFFYDNLGRMFKVKDALNQETVYGYNEVGQQISQTDALNRTTRYEYDRLGRRVKRVLPLGQIETYSYSNDGSLSSKTDFNGKTTTFGYDNMRRLLSKTPDASLNQPTVSFTYNLLGQRQTMTDATGTTTYSYDVRNRLTSKQTPFGTLSYTYNDASNLQSVNSNHTNGVSVEYSYDVLNRLQSVKDNRLPSGANTTNYTYDSVGNLQSYSYPNGITTSYAYNTLNRLTTLTVSNGASNLASYSYTLGASGNRTSVAEQSGRVVNYTYDDLYRLTSETIVNSQNATNNGSISYGYDSVGNRLQRTSSVSAVPNQTNSFDANDRLQSDSYDANGNTIQSNTNSYAYDFENRLTSLNNGQATFIYDGDGNRVGKTVNGVTTNYLIDTNNLTGYAQVVEEIQNGNVTKQFTFGHDLISQNCSPLTANCSLSFYGYDGHGSVRLLTDALGVVTDTYDFDAFGSLINSTGTTENDYLYTGEQFDANLGFYYLRARYMNPSRGRFVSMDSFEGDSFDPISLHKYLYANSDGVNKIDPTGKFTLIQALAVVGVIVVLAAIAGIY